MSIFDKEFKEKPNQKKKKKGSTLPKVYREHTELVTYCGKKLDEMLDGKKKVDIGKK